SLEVICNEPERRLALKNNTELLRSLIRESGLDIGHSRSQIISVVLGANDRALSVAEELQREGFDVRALRPPTVPDGTARLRITVNAKHDEPTIRRFARSLEKICSAVCS